ncbi:MAG: gp53-like domain-containing protein [Terrimicrobiaceae bacterium]
MPIQQITTSNTFAQWLTSTQALIENQNYYEQNLNIVVNTANTVANVYLVNAARIYSNTVNVFINTTAVYSNTVNVFMNTETVYANTVRVFRNTETVYSNTVNVSNDIRSYVSSSYDAANAAAIISQQAYDTANLAVAAANSAAANNIAVRADIKANAAFDLAVRANVHAQAAFNAANSGVRTGFTTFTSAGVNVVPNSNTSTLTLVAGDNMRIIGDSATRTFTIHGNTATRWATARTITLTNGASGSVSIDGTTDVNLPVNINPGFIGSNQNLAIPGYQKLPGGLIMQWGTYTTTTNDGQVSITFPIVFPNTFLTGQVSQQYSSGSGGPEITSEFQSPTTTGMILRWGRQSGSDSDRITIHWFVIGY